MAADWPTHRVKARTRQDFALGQKKRNRRQRKLFKAGKRGPLNG